MEAPCRPRLPRGWRAQWDTTYSEWFYINLSTGYTQWDKPIAPARKPRNVPEGWEASWDTKFEEWFYANIYTAETQWEKPTEPAQALPPTQTRANHAEGSIQLPLRGLDEQAGSRPETPSTDRFRDIDGRDVAKKALAAKDDKPQSRRQRKPYNTNIDPADWGINQLSRAELLERAELFGTLSATMREGGNQLDEMLLRLEGKEIPDREVSNRNAPYQQLEDADSFRLLELYPRSRKEPLSGTLLQSVQFDDQRGYEALSYRWSDVNPNEPTSIEIDGVSFPIGPELHSALIQFRQEVAPRRLWIDQICIDQNYEAERTQQLKIMADIYKNAQTVLIWLGQASYQSDVAMEVFPMLVEHIRRNEETAKLQKTMQPPSDIIQRGGALADALCHLFERPWFGRVWTLQEAALAKSAEIWCGTKWFQFELLETFATGCYRDQNGHWINAAELIEPTRSAADPENPRRAHNVHAYIISKLKGGTAGSASILNSLRSLDCSQDRDRIYSVLHFLDATLVAEISANATPSTAELYHNAAMSGIEHGELDYLGASGLSQHCASYAIGQQTPGKQYLKLPSWVADWTYRIRTHSYWVHHRDHVIRNGTPLFSAGGLEAAACPCLFSKDGKILVVTGLIVDEIERCTPPFRFLAIPERVGDSSIEDQVGIVREAMTAYQSFISSCMGFAEDCSSKYGSRTMLQRACRHSLVGGMMPEGSTSIRGVIQRASDEAVDSVFNGFETMLWVLEEGENLAAMSYTLVNEGSAEMMADVKARFAKLASLRGELNDSPKKYNLLHAMADGCKGRLFFTTSNDCYMGVAPDLTEPGDKLCVLSGCCAPFIVRPKGNAYQLVGECYVPGIMDGEIMDSQGHCLETILLE